MTGGRPKKEKPSVSNKKTNGFKEENQRLQNQKPNVNVNANGNVNVNANIYTPEFEEIWSHYPRKKEKAAAYKAYKARRKSYSDQELDLAVERYAQECRILGTEEKFIKHGATFFGPSLPFTDYLTKDWRPPEAPGKARNTFHNFDQRDYDYDQLEKKLTGAM